MQNRDQPANAIQIDNGVDEPTQYKGLSKLEYAAIQIYAANTAAGPVQATLAAHELLDHVGMTRGCLQANPDKYLNNSQIVPPTPEAVESYLRPETKADVEAEYQLPPGSLTETPATTEEPSHERRDPDND